MANKKLSDTKFGIFLSAEHTGASWKTIKNVTLECEELGYHSIWLGDHLTPGDTRLESWTTLSALSTITEKIRLGHLVLCNSFRSPSLLAKMAATLDNISGGRLEFGIGAGGWKPEYQAYGFPFPKLSIRVEQLKEALDIISKMWTEEKPSYAGKYYNIKEATCEPKPLQKPHPPITIGGGGELIMKVVAAYADRCNFLGPIERYKENQSVLENYCLQLGRDYKEIEKSQYFFIVTLYKEKLSKGDWVRAMRRIYEREGYARSKSFDDWILQVKPRSMLATPDECAVKIQEYRDIGVTYFILRFVDILEKGESFRLFIDKVAPIIT